MKRTILTIIAAAAAIAAFSGGTYAQNQNADQPQAQRAPRGARAGARQQRPPVDARPKVPQRAEGDENKPAKAPADRPRTERRQISRRQDAAAKNRTADPERVIIRRIMSHLRQCPQGLNCPLGRQAMQPQQGRGQARGQNLMQQPRQGRGQQLMQQPRQGRGQQLMQQPRQGRGQQLMQQPRQGRGQQPMQQPRQGRGHQSMQQGSRDRVRLFARRNIQQRLSREDREAIRSMIRQYLAERRAKTDDDKSPRPREEAATPRPDRSDRTNQQPQRRQGSGPAQRGNRGG